MASVRASERLRLDPGEHRAISVITTDPCLPSQPWAPGLARIHITLELVATEKLVRLAAASDVVLLPMTAGSAMDSLLLVPQVLGSCTTPVLIAVERGCERAAAQAVDAGAAAYLFLPYLRTTVVRQLRRLAERSPRSKGGDVLSVGRVVMDVRRREVTVDGLVAPMPAREFEILRMLLERAGDVVPTQDILIRLWTDGEDSTRSLSVHIRRLRERLESDPSHPTLLRTVRGVGYTIST